MSTTLRIKFERTGPVRYIGHLDMMRYFQKAIMRAGIDIRYSEGFNPHQIMSFAYPLGVSMETRGDYFDIDVLSYQDCETITGQLNDVMADGIRVVSATVLPEGAKNAMASVAAADYLVHLCYGNRETVSQKDIMSDGETGSHTLTDEMLQQFLSQKEIFITKETGKKNSVEDIRPGIFVLEQREDQMLFMKLKSGSDGNIKPAAVLEALSDMFSLRLVSDRIIRLEIYGKDEDGALVPLG
ncbi:MAG: TIGR03936 family radical SAM-associated protein [Lachnospiraceae bacterium]|nr:TIGR03936 family radical SAM-associated protein [Lachnospiraceae bacterium]MDE6742947.1 TIGR03936 family radical SAM-associated protein [Lachnospiraceae bacterium]